VAVGYWQTAGCRCGRALESITSEKIENDMGAGAGWSVMPAVAAYAYYQRNFLDAGENSQLLIAGTVRTRTP
jgi:hypothetical protein